MSQPPRPPSRARGICLAVIGIALLALTAIDAPEWLRLSSWMLVLFGGLALVYGLLEIVASRRRV
ncbi:MAG TPA: hypothetical protein VM557_02700 [Thermoanaerobaculia bacterium]|nr:hypothetical protein [Thermoanaerobaculia bacterium]